MMGGILCVSDEMLQNFLGKIVKIQTSCCKLQWHVAFYLFDLFNAKIQHNAKYYKHISLYIA